MHCLIIDDEPLAHKVILTYAEAMPHIEVIGSAHSAMEAMAFLSKTKADLLFLDINMPKLQGLDFLKTLANPPLVIITTAYQEFALESYELRVIDYLLKPFPLERFVKAVNRAEEQFALVNPSTKPVENTTTKSSTASETLFIKGDKKMHQVRLDEIQYFESYGSYVKVHLKDELIITLERLTNFEDKMKAFGFIRIHKSYLIPVNKIDFIEGNELKIGDKKLPIGAVYRHNVKDLFE